MTYYEDIKTAVHNDPSYSANRMREGRWHWLNHSEVPIGFQSGLGNFKWTVCSKCGQVSYEEWSSGLLNDYGWGATLGYLNSENPVITFVTILLKLGHRVSDQILTDYNINPYSLG